MSAPNPTVMPQSGIFSLGTAEHAYLEFDLHPDASATEFVTLLAGLSDPLSTVGGVNVVIGYRPALWESVAPALAASGVTGFDADLVGPDGFTMPGTQHDGWVWIAGGNRTAVFDNARAVMDAVAPVAALVSELSGWVYRYDRDLTGFIDGTENPSLLEAPGIAICLDGPGAGSSVVLVQQWQHDTSGWTQLSDADQELVIGRTKPDSVELGDTVKPATSHVARTVLEQPDGSELDIFRRNVAYGSAADHGTMFVGFCGRQYPLQTMLERMAGIGDGVRDALTRYTTPLTGAYYVVPGLDALATFAPPEDD